MIYRITQTNYTDNNTYGSTVVQSESIGDTLLAKLVGVFLRFRGMNDER